MLRVTGGKNRSRKILTPSVSTTKPTMDRVREGIFSALQNDIRGANVLDLYAGSGSYSFESLSRGAASSTAVDCNNEAIKTINQNSIILGENNLKVVKDDVISFLNKTTEQFDIIFVDPPYKLMPYKDVTKLIFERNILSEKGIIVLESENPLKLDIEYLIKEYKYGIAHVYIIRK